MAIGLLPASFRGVPFGVLVDSLAGGRRIALHTYPGRDDPWAEDMGRAPRRFPLRGFLVEGDRKAGGLPIEVQRLLLKTAFEAAGSGPLIHPTLGAFTVACINFSLGQELDAKRRSTVTVDFIEAGQQQFPSVLSLTSSGVLGAVSKAVSSIAGDFVGTLGSLVSKASALINLPAIVPEWTSQVLGLGNDATALLKLAAQLPGNNGRYASGGNAGFVAKNASPYAADVTVSDLIKAASDQRSTIAARVDDLDAAAVAYGATTDAPGLPPMVTSVIDALVAACADPADAMRLLGKLVAFVPAGASARSIEGLAMSDLFRRSAAIALASVSSTYQPRSYDDAFATLQSVTGILDDEITLAGDTGQDDTFTTLRGLRVSVVKDLRARGATLSPMQEFDLPANLPSLVLAQRLYRDPARADELVTEAATVSPLFMPASFQALAA